jgi:predicted transposase/invertase (TIGR01784 family)
LRPRRKEYVSAISEGEAYTKLPKGVVLSIVAYNMFDCEEFHSKFQVLEVNRHTLLTDKMDMHYFELPKFPGLPKTRNPEDDLELWLALFKARTEEELEQLEALEVTEMQEAIKAYRRIVTTDEFKELERLRDRALHDEATALGHARRKAMAKGKAKGIVQGRAEGIVQGRAEGEARSDAKWEGVVADQGAEITRLRALLEANQS